MRAREVLDGLVVVQLMVALLCTATGVRVGLGQGRPGIGLGLGLRSGLHLRLELGPGLRSGLPQGTVVSASKGIFWMRGKSVAGGTRESPVPSLRSPFCTKNRSRPAWAALAANRS